MALASNTIPKIKFQIIITMFQGTYMLKEFMHTLHQLPQIEFVSQLSPSNVTHSTLQTIADGKADFDIEGYQMSHSRYQYVDYMYPIMDETAMVFMYTAYQGKILNVFIYSTCYGFSRLCVLS